MEQFLTYALIGLLVVAALPYVLVFLIGLLDVIKTIIGYILAIGLFYGIGFIINQIFEYFTNTSNPEAQYV